RISKTPPTEPASLGATVGAAGSGTATATATATLDPPPADGGWIHVFGDVWARDARTAHDLGLAAGTVMRMEAIPKLIAAIANADWEARSCHWYEQCAVADAEQADATVKSVEKTVAAATAGSDKD